MKDSYSIFDLLNYKFSKNLIKKFGIAYICFGITIFLIIGIGHYFIWSAIFKSQREADNRFKNRISIFDTWSPSRNPNNPSYEQIKKYDSAIDKCYKNFGGAMDTKRTECEKYFREKYRSVLEGYDEFEENKKERIFEKIKESDSVGN